MSDPKLYDLIVKNECRNTHHKLVMNSLKRLECRHADAWLQLFVRYFETYLEGSKDPDTKFKDFRNHVIHVSENYWGGAVGQAEKWYAATVDHLRNARWPDAVYSAGVLSHYYMDPIMPLHTGQTEEEGVIHRACEWSVNKSFQKLIEQLESTSGYPTVNIPSGPGWMKAAVHQGAEVAHSHYQTFIDHYNFELGSKNPPAGLDPRLQQITGQLLGYASVGFARILERAFAESGAQPGNSSSSMFALLYKVTAPISWAFKGLTYFRSRGQVKKIAAEFKSTGKVVKALPKDEQQVRHAHAEEILKIDIEELNQKKIGAIGSKSETVAPPPRRPSVRPRPKRKEKSKVAEGNDSRVFRLDPDAPLEDAPSIGPKTARRFEPIGIKTVGDFLSADAEQMADDIDMKHITTEIIQQWQTQARLACAIPGIYGHDAQILAACGFESPSEIASSEPKMVLSLVDEFVKTREAKFILRSSKRPDIDEVSNWVAWSKQHRKLDAA